MLSDSQVFLVDRLELFSSTIAMTEKGTAEVCLKHSCIAGVEQRNRFIHIFEQYVTETNLETKVVKRTHPNRSRDRSILGALTQKTNS